MQSLADLICVVSMLTASVFIREAYLGYNKGERTMLPQLHEFFSTLGLIQRDSVWWVHTVVPSMFRPQPAEYKACLRKVLFLEPSEAYSRDGWPPEADRRSGKVWRLRGQGTAGFLKLIEGQGGSRG